MTNAAQINSELQVCHDPEGGVVAQSLVGDGKRREYLECADLSAFFAGRDLSRPTVWIIERTGRQAALDLKR